MAINKDKFDPTFFEPPHKEMGRHVKTGVLNSGAVQIIKVLCQFFSVIIMSRLLPPSDFGLVAMAGPVYAFVNLFLDLGLNQATVQKARLTHEEANAFFWLNVGAGIALAILLALLSPVAGWYYEDSRVTGLTAAMAGLIAISAFGNQHNGILNRRMSFQAVSLIDMAGTVAGLTVSIITALTLKNYWALYIGQATTVIVPVIGSWLATKWRPSGPHIPKHIGGSLKFGLGITGFNVANFFARNMDNVLIGRFGGSVNLGMYDRAYKLLLFPLQRIVQPVAAVMFPVLSRLLEEPEKYRDMYLKVMRYLLLLTWPGILWAIVFGSTLITTLLGDQWRDTAPIFLPLSVVALVQVVNSISGTLFITQGRSGQYARWGVFGGVTSVIAFAIGLSYGAIGVATAYAVSEYLRTPLLWLYAAGKGPVRVNHILGATVPFIGAALVTFGALIGLHMSDIAQGLPLLILGGFASYIAFAASLLIFPNGRRTITEMLQMVRQLAQRKKPHI